MTQYTIGKADLTAISCRPEEGPSPRCRCRSCFNIFMLAAPFLYLSGRPRPCEPGPRSLPGLDRNRDGSRFRGPGQPSTTQVAKYTASNGCARLKCGRYFTCRPSHRRRGCLSGWWAWRFNEPGGRLFVHHGCTAYFSRRDFYVPAGDCGGPGDHPAEPGGDQGACGWKRAISNECSFRDPETGNLLARPACPEATERCGECEASMEPGGPGKCRRLPRRRPGPFCSGHSVARQIPPIKRPPFTGLDDATPR